uniref:Uncharacterized protein n=1 Tax=Panagrolaimus superbus TaxID=310955 RepID=A0A914YJJ0_9BILA
MIDHSSNISFLTPSSTGYQEVPSSAWNYGYDSLGRFQKRIIVMDLNDKKYAHEYGVYGGGSIRCLGCYRVRHSYRPAKFDNQKKLFVPTNHLCTPKLYAEIKEEQEKFAAKNNRSENSVSSRSKRSRINNLVLKEDSDASLNDTRQRDSNNDNPQGDADNDNHDDPQNDADNDNPQGDAYDVDNWNDFLQAPSPPSTVNSVVSAALPIQTPSPPNSVRRYSILSSIRKILTNMC